MYGLPNSAIYGTYKRVRYAVKKTRRSETPESQIAWLAGWLVMGLLYGLGRVIVALT